MLEKLRTRHKHGTARRCGHLGRLERVGLRQRVIDANCTISRQSTSVDDQFSARCATAARRRQSGRGRIVNSFGLGLSSDISAKRAVNGSQESSKFWFDLSKCFQMLHRLGGMLVHEAPHGRYERSSLAAACSSVFLDEIVMT